MPPPFEPRAYLAPETLVQLAPFELRAKMIVEGVMSGMHRSPYQGMAVEFAQHRQYVAGDDLKHLDWKVFGRSDKLYIKQYQQETNLDVIVLDRCVGVDGLRHARVKRAGAARGASRGKSGCGRSSTTPRRIAVALAYLCLHQQDRVGVVVFADEIRSMLKRSSARGQWRRIVNALSVEPVEARTNLVKVADQV